MNLAESIMQNLHLRPTAPQADRRQHPAPQAAASRSSTFSRRDFIRASASLAVTRGILGSPSPARSAQKPPCCTVACRDGHLKVTGKPDSWSALKELGATGVEVLVNERLQCTGLYHPEKTYSLATTNSISALRADLEANGMIVTAFCMNNRLDERLELELAWASRLVAAATQLDVPAIRIDLVPRTIKSENFLPFAIKACRQLCDLADATPVRYGIENHGHWSNKPEILEKLFDAVGSTHLGLTLDAMNFYWFGHPLKDLYDICAKFAPRTVHTHCKNLRYPDDKKNAPRPVGWEYDQHAAPLYDGDLDYQRIVQILRRANYTGDLCLENECLSRFPKEQHPAILKQEVALLRKLAAG
jgi:sugar phosphate isomerase/epimerase